MWCVALLALTPLSASAADCISEAESAYALPPGILLAISRVEGGRLAIGHSNTNGTADLGPWQVNTIHLAAAAKVLKRDEPWIRRHLVRSVCFSAAMAGWVLAQRMADAARAGRTLEWAIGAYHSRTPGRNATYANKVLSEWR